MKNLLSVITVNFLTIAVLLTLFAAPIYFAHNFTQVAGVKTESQYLIVSQFSKFPNLKFEQIGENYSVSISKQANSQAFLSVFIINNPAKTNKTYSVNIVRGETKIFFGQDLQNQTTRITAPAGSSIPISLLSYGTSSEDSVEFKIEAN